MLIAQLLASPFHGGPERQVLGLAQHLPESHQTVFLSLAEGGRARDFLRRTSAAGFESIELKHNWPHLIRVVRELEHELRSRKVDILCTNGYKPDILGWLAARRIGIPVVAIAHGWTGANARARVYEAVDRWVMRRMDHVVSVSQAQGERVLAAGVSTQRMQVIENAIAVDTSRASVTNNRRRLEQLFSKTELSKGPPKFIAVAAGRLSPEKAFDVLIRAARDLVGTRSADIGFVVFGDGPERDSLRRQILAASLQARFIMAGFRDDLTDWLQDADCLVLSSHTEGLPVVLLEGMAAGLPSVATAVGGVPEVVRHGQEGYVVPANDPSALADAIHRLTESPEDRRRMSASASARVAQVFSCATQAERYLQLFERLLNSGFPVRKQRAPAVPS